MNVRKLSSTSLQNEIALENDCPFIYALSLMGKRWKPAILWKMSEEGCYRFSGFKREIPQISEKMLTQHLRELESDGLITRTVYTEMPLRVEYALTELGLSLQPILSSLYQWGDKAQKIKKDFG
ncbi:winged helix-turn-helix transcriptional regulator [Chryseobacterium sp. G0201]|uniref:winged helix-turn-helix transcriptional regulator n=1 Tax=Chryseobacterium sp. G0201 TaxID=2487065 RepID=UPI000F50B33D|nr:helix-turn-helix domain-containing protein [Chryseobacterium sp. G0201]AZA55028.1 transcriptional regulator [Chryseobacterium sp. G0201]